MSRAVHTTEIENHTYFTGQGADITTARIVRLCFIVKRTQSRRDFGLVVYAILDIYLSHDLTAPIFA